MLAVQLQRSSFIQRLPKCLPKRLPVCLTGPMTVEQVVKIGRPYLDFMLMTRPDMVSNRHGHN